MSILTDDMKRVVNAQRLAYVATVCPDGTPNVRPLGTVKAWGDDHLVFACIRSASTLRNLAHHPALEINVVDPFIRKGYRFKGTGAVHTEGPVFEDGVTIYTDRGFFEASQLIQAIVRVRVEEAEPLISPAYARPVSEADVAEHWAAYYETLRRWNPPKRTPDNGETSG
ncbi:pyridoxamine 5'-phosphate oxidase family protein [Rhodocaloribacter sp.]